MFSRRIAPATLGAVLILTAGVAPVSAAPPTRTGPAAERPFTPEEEAASDRKVAAAMSYLASAEAQAETRSSLACVTPESDETATERCEVPHGFLPVSARDQTRGHYCGPATGQVIANYTWAMALNANKYSQAKLADWMQTDVLGGTSAFTMEDGLELATIGAPRRPAGWDWVVTRLEDTDFDGAFADQLYAYVRANVSGSKMGLAVPVLPHERGGRFHLSSWPRPVNSPGHWIAAYGWRGIYDGTTSAQFYYTDSSKDEGGSTGKFWDPMKHVAGMIRDHTQRFVW